MIARGNDDHLCRVPGYYQSGRDAGHYLVTGGAPLVWWVILVVL